VLALLALLGPTVTSTVPRLAKQPAGSGANGGVVREKVEVPGEDALAVVGDAADERSRELNAELWVCVAALAVGAAAGFVAERMRRAGETAGKSGRRRG
jgi:hypothetical protein